jgi:LPS-assembly protein
MTGGKFLAAIGPLADRRWRVVISGGVVGYALLLASIFCPTASLAQDDVGFSDVLRAEIEPGAQMLVESDQLVYDYDNNTVSAVGNVRIYYGRYTLEAEKVTYLRDSGRLIATGFVKLTDPDGAVYYSDQFDITDDFANGFVESLRVEAADRTYFAAARAEREGGQRTTFVKGVYTACEPCADRPEKPPFWQVKAAKIIHDQKEKMIYFEKAKFEFLGVPIAWFPYFSTPDPTVKRKSGFLTPTFGYSDTLGTTFSVPYFWNMAPNYDLTFTPHVLTRQGFLAEVEWRHRLNNGQYSLKMAGIHQEDPGAFLELNSDGTVKSGGYAQKDWGAGLRTTGEFDINQYWSYGWDITAQNYRTFTRNYGVLNDADEFATSSVHLTGMSERNWFDTRAYYFQVLVDDPDNLKYDQEKQPIVGVTDYDYIFDNPIFGGELTASTNFTKLYREDEDPFSMTNGDYTPVTIDGVQYYHGLGGTNVRASTMIEWQREIITPMGQLIKPFAYVRADAFGLDLDPPTLADSVDVTDDNFALRAVPAVGVDWSLPVMAQTGYITHVFEPMAQLIARPNSTFDGTLPNEDAQSLVFDDSILFEPDKYSGYDLVETGVRANVGFRYRGTFANGGSIEGLIGQSFHLAGENPFAMEDVAHAGLASGLETDRSDYVGRMSFDSGVGPRLDFRGRFDEENLEIQRGEIEASNALGPLTASASYLYLRDYPNDPDAEVPISVLRGAAALNFHENWRLYGALAYDVKNEQLAASSVGLAYHNSCVTFAVTYSETREDYSDIVASRTINVLLSLRTLGAVQQNADISGLVGEGEE